MQSRPANRAGRRAFGRRAGGVCALCQRRDDGWGDVRGGNEVRPGGRLVRGLCRCSWPAGPAWAATARSAVRLGRRTDGCAREKHAGRRRAGGRKASARTFIYIILLLLSPPPPPNTHTHARIYILLLLYIRRSHVTPELGVCALEGGRASTITVGCIRMGGGECVVARDEGGQTKYELSRCRTRTRGARWPHIFSCASFSPPPSPPGRPPILNLLNVDDDARHIRRPRLAPQPPIRLDAPRSATTIFFYLSAARPARPENLAFLPGPLFVSVPFFALFFARVRTALGARVVWPPRSLRANVYEKTISPAVDVKLSRDVIFSNFFFPLFLFDVIFVCFSSFPRLIPFLARRASSFLLRFLCANTYSAKAVHALYTYLSTHSREMWCIM